MSVTCNSLVIWLFVAYRERVARPFGRGADGWVVCVCDLCYAFSVSGLSKNLRNQARIR
jgi:hypothetical protein